MNTLLTLARVLVTLLLALLTVSFIVGLAAPEVGIVEKVVLVALIAGCVLLAGQLPGWTEKVQGRLHRR